MPTQDITKGLKALASSADAYKTAEAYYTGEVREFFSNANIRAKLGEGSKAFRLPFAAKVVDAPINVIDVASITTDGGAAAQNALDDRILGANQLDEELPEVFRKAAYFGDYYLTVWPEPDADDDSVADDVDQETEVEVDTTTLVEVFLNSPLSFRVIYSNENSRRALFAIKTWEADESTSETPLWRVNLYYTDRVEQWITRQGKGQTQDGTDFEPYLVDPEKDPESWIIDNEWNTLPVFHYRQGDKPYGTPVHKRAFGAQDAITKINVTHLSTIDYLGFPQRYALVDADAEGDAADDDFVEFDTSASPNLNPDGPTRPTRQKSKLRSGPGETWWLENVKSVGQFEAAGHEPFLEPMKFQIAAMAVLTDTPADEFNTDGTQTPPSGEARRQSRSGMIRNARKMAASYGSTTERMLELALRMLGFPDASVTVTFAPFETMSGLDDWQTVAAKLTGGVPLRTVLIEAGYSAEQVDEWYPKNAPALSPAQITALATALTSLGQATALGALPSSAIRNAIPEFFVGLPEETEPLVVRPPIDPLDIPTPPAS